MSSFGNQVSKAFAKRSVCLLMAIASVGLGGCAGGYYGTAYRGRGYVTAPGIAVSVEDRPYYTHGPGYYVGRRYYVWRGGHWRHRHGHRVWVPGHYVIR